MPESFQLERIFVKIFLRDVGIHFGQNVRLIRKELKYTQLMMVKILRIGFRTYVRYEVRKRDAPALVLIKLSYLGGISPK